MYKLYKATDSAYPYMLISGRRALFFDLKNINNTVENIATYGWTVNLSYNFTEPLICEFETISELYNEYPELLI